MTATITYTDDRTLPRHERVGQVTPVLLRQMREWTLTKFGEGAEGGQAVVRARLVRVLLDMAQWATEVPDGLLEVEAALAPAARRPSALRACCRRLASVAVGGVGWSIDVMPRGAARWVGLRVCRG